MQNKENYGSISSNSLLKYDTYKLIFRNMIGVFAIKGSMKNLESTRKESQPQASHNDPRCLIIINIGSKTTTKASIFKTD